MVWLLVAYGAVPYRAVWGFRTRAAPSLAASLTRRCRLGTGPAGLESAKELRCLVCSRKRPVPVVFVDSESLGFLYGMVWFGSAPPTATTTPGGFLRAVSGQKNAKAL